ncbi:hypothetical protein D3C72_2391710 [compost metagenome]
MARDSNDSAVVTARFTHREVNAHEDVVFAGGKLSRLTVPIRERLRIENHVLLVDRIVHILRVKRLRAVVPFPRKKLP